jgi:hypothetical protein
MQSSDRPFSSHQKQRRHSRFDLKFPVALSFPSQGEVRKLDAVSENVSLKGLLLKAGARVPARTPVSLTMEVRGPRFQHPVRLVAKGVVVRIEALRNEDGYAIAIECQRPLVERPLVERKTAEDSAKASAVRGLPEAG